MELGYEYRMLSCGADMHKHPAILITMFMIYLFIFAILLPFFYIKIFIYLKKSKSKVHNYNLYQRDHLSFLFNLSKGLACSVFIFGLSFFLYVSVIMLKNVESNFLDVVYKYFYLFNTQINTQ